jgi:hypothetical protein
MFNSHTITPPKIAVKIGKDICAHIGSPFVFPAIHKSYPSSLFCQSLVMVKCELAAMIDAIASSAGSDRSNRINRGSTPQSLPAAHSHRHLLTLHHQGIA